MSAEQHVLQRALARVFSYRPEQGAAAERKGAAGSFISLHHWGGAHWSARDYAALAREGVQQNPIVYRCIRLISEAAASIPFQVIADGSVMRDHPLADILSQPNPEQSGAELFEQFYGYLQTSGDAFLEAVTLEGRVRELHALRPDRIKIRADQRGRPDAYEYAVGLRKLMYQRDPASGFSPIFHLRLFHPLDDHHGLSPLEPAARSIDLHNSAAAWNKALLDNAARPSGALVYKGPDGAPNLSEEQFERLKAELSDIYQGAENAGRPLLLEGGLDWRQMSLSPADMDFLNAKNTAAREIALALGVPPMLLGVPGDNTYSNYREANLAFWKQTVLPLLRKTAAALANWARPAFGPLKITFDHNEIDALAAEREARWVRISRADFMTRNEKRQAVGLPPLMEADALDPN